MQLFVSNITRKVDVHYGQMCGRHMKAFQRYLLPKKEKTILKVQQFECQLQQMRHKLQELQVKLQHQVEFTDVYRVRNNEMYDVM